MKHRDWGRKRCLDPERPWQEYKQGFRDLEGRRIVLVTGKSRGLVLGTASWIQGRAGMGGEGWSGPSRLGQAETGTCGWELLT